MKRWLRAALVALSRLVLYLLAIVVGSLCAGLLAYMILKLFVE